MNGVLRAAKARAVPWPGCLQAQRPVRPVAVGLLGVFAEAGARLPLVEWDDVIEALGGRCRSPIRRRRSRGVLALE